jgi:hypothetical protein
MDASLVNASDPDPATAHTALHTATSVLSSSNSVPAADSVKDMDEIRKVIVQEANTGGVAPFGTPE